ncbi:MAG: ISL3 family transposase [Sulfuriferula multivorans]|uniref:ISL3 family transposase n=1 Tax=Sulfuriferula multivorans TaxID=1559896 RepID=A0A7C9K8V6_9PROT|nr:ISL3 family transposase [Sulfuriferula multivorans]
MLLTRLLNACHHFPGFVYTAARLCKATNTIEIEVRARTGSKPCCSGCHKPASGYDQLPQRRFEFIPIWGFAVFLLYSMRRVECRQCGVKVEEVPWAIGKHQLTKAYMLYLAHWARKMSWKDTAISFHTTWEKVQQAVAYVVQWGLEHRQLGGIRAIGVDEIAYGKGHEYLTLVYQIEAGCTRLLWVGEKRTKETFQKFFDLIGKELSSKIEFVCSDMWKPYLDLIKQNCTGALNILDRFHVVAKLNKAIDEIRAGEARQLVKDGFDPVLKKSRWCLLKRPQNLTDHQRIKLKDVLRYNLKSVRAYLFKEYFQQFWEYESPAWAGKFLDQWCKEVMRSRIDPLKKFVGTVRKHRELLLNYFRARKAFSSGIVEGLNNKAKVTMRKAYGFRTFKMTEIALYHVLGKLPEPKLAHSFY